MTATFPTEFSASDIRALIRAKSRLEHPGLTARLADLFGKPIDEGLRALPAGWNRKAIALARGALMKGLQFAIKTLGSAKKVQSRDRLHRLLAVASGVAGGAAGMTAMAIEIPISTTLMLRSIAEIARSEGHDISLLETRLSCLAVFAFGGQNEGEGSAEEGYWVVRAALARSISQATAYISERGLFRESAPPLVRFISAIASRFSSVITEEMAAKAVPVIGALAGGAINLAFMQHFQRIARGHFVIKRLENKYGAACIEQLYREISLSDLK